jgi:hypothetical protein
LALARHAERSGDVQQNAGATVAFARNMAGFMHVGIVDRATDATGNGSSCDVPELILGDGIRLRLPVYVLEPLLLAKAQATTLECLLCSMALTQSASLPVWLAFACKGTGHDWAPGERTGLPRSPRYGTALQASP